MVEAVGIEPTLFLMSLIYSQLPSPLSTHFRGTSKENRTPVCGMKTHRPDH